MELRDWTEYLILERVASLRSHIFTRATVLSYHSLRTQIRPYLCIMSSSLLRDSTLQALPCPHCVRRCVGTICAAFAVISILDAKDKRKRGYFFMNDQQTYGPRPPRDYSMIPSRNIFHPGLVRRVWNTECTVLASLWTIGSVFITYLLDLLFCPSSYNSSFPPNPLS